MGTQDYGSAQGLILRSHGAIHKPFFSMDLQTTTGTASGESQALPGMERCFLYDSIPPQATGMQNYSMLKRTQMEVTVLLTN